MSAHRRRSDAGCFGEFACSPGTRCQGFHDLTAGGIDQGCEQRTETLLLIRRCRHASIVNQTRNICQPSQPRTGHFSEPAVQMPRGVFATHNPRTAFSNKPSGS